MRKIRQKQQKSKHSSRAGNGQEIVARRLTRFDPETGIIKDLYVSSRDPSVIKSEYYFSRNLSIGSQNAKREIQVAFQSLEIEDNARLLHLLHKNMRS